MRKKSYALTPKLIQNYLLYQKEQERSAATIQKYAHDLNELYQYLDGQPLNKFVLIGWKQKLTETHAPATVNSMLTAVNGYLSHMGWPEMKVKLLKIQKALFLDEQKELTRSEYVRLVQAAEHNGNERLSLVIQTICATGIRVSELRFITAEAVCCGRAGIAEETIKSAGCRFHGGDVAGRLCRAARRRRAVRRSWEGWQNFYLNVFVG